MNQEQRRPQMNSHKSSKDSSASAARRMARQRQCLPQQIVRLDCQIINKCTLAREAAAAAVFMLLDHNLGSIWQLPVCVCVCVAGLVQRLPEYYYRLAVGKEFGSSHCTLGKIYNLTFVSIKSPGCYIRLCSAVSLLFTLCFLAFRIRNWLASIVLTT